MPRCLAILVAFALIATGCGLPPEPLQTPTVKPLPPDTLTHGVLFLLKQQSADGAWRSDVYAAFKDGTALTPFVLCSLLDSADLKRADSAAAREKAVAWLAKFVNPDGSIEPGPDGFDYPVYTAPLRVKALSHPENAEHRAARDAWVKFLKERQLTEKLGWKPDEKQYGGWGYCRAIPKKPEPNTFAPPLIESNLSATVFALDALKAADALDADTAKAAAAFVRSCQNDDGGFHFIYDDPVRNKAGKANDDPLLFHSYGSATADGFRALQLCGFPIDSMHIEKSRCWLIQNFRADRHPGEYVTAHEPNREAVYFYYAASVSRTFRDCRLKLPDGRDWSAELSAELTKRQREDGSWVNRVELVRENDPIVATGNAVSALAKCKR